ncbi:MAG: carbamoyl-phosphate synthase small subunit [Chitinophagaceae bacterium]|nr:MAG: carbamoyl-phosphate synthase small subunit [Chitinophagaceae bacterium]
MSSAKTGILLLEDGTIFKGKASGKLKTSSGEICFNTGMTGYQEVFTDPSYSGQLLVMTNAHIGNYGYQTEETESDKVQISGLICNRFSSFYSRKSADGSLESFLTENEILVIHDIDTRALVHHIRKKGAMNAIISGEDKSIEELTEMLKNTPSMEGLELSSKVSVKEAYEFGNPNAEIKIAALDLGIKKNILRCLDERACFIKVFPAKTSFSEMEKWNPNAYFISNGPGDPSPMDYAIQTVKEILDAKKPIFGICLGNQILALACGLKTFKLHHGHRGLNHPVINNKSRLSEITSQNHGFSVSTENLENFPNIEVTHTNLNDNTIAGIRLKDRPAFAVQYHPESSAGPHDSRYLFDDFVKMIKENMLTHSITP